MSDQPVRPADDVADRPLPYDLILDALSMTYEGTDGIAGAEFWADGAAMIVTTLIDFGWLPPEADPVLNDGGAVYPDGTHVRDLVAEAEAGEASDYG